MFEPYRLQEMGGERAIRILQDLLAQLSMVESDDDLTTFELNILHRCAVNPPFGDVIRVAVDNDSN